MANDQCSGHDAFVEYRWYDGIDAGGTTWQG